MNNKGHWLDKHIEEQRSQRELLDKITAPYTAEELAEFITEDMELIMMNIREDFMRRESENKK